jgi:uncharacterized OB-fold protein
MTPRPLTDDDREDYRMQAAEAGWERHRERSRRGPLCGMCGERHPVREDCSGCDDHLAAEAETDDEC